MRIRRRWVIGSLLGLGALSAVAVGVAVAAPSGDDGERPRDKIIERAASILGIETDRLEDAIQQAQADLDEERRDERLQELVADGVISQEEADQIKAWLDSMPDAIKKLPFKHFLPGPALRGHPDVFVVPKLEMLHGDIGRVLDDLVADGVITQEKADEIRALLKEGALEFKQFEVAPFHGERFERRFRFDGPRHFGPGFPHELPFEWKRAPEATPIPGT